MQGVTLISSVLRGSGVLAQSHLRAISAADISPVADRLFP
jgi:hypothetical protein